MKISAKAFLGILLITVLASCENKSNQSNIEQDDRFIKFRDYFIESLWRISPSSAIYAGYHKYDSLLIAPSAENRERIVSEYKALGDSIKSFDEKKLSELNRIDLWMMRDQV